MADGSFYIPSVTRYLPDKLSQINMNIVPFVAAYFLFFGIYLVFRDSKVSDWRHTEGRLVRSHIGSANKPIENFTVADYVYQYTISAHLEYEYNVGGQKYVGNRLSLSLIYGNKAVLPFIRKQLENVQVFSDGNLKVFYDPLNPKKSVLLKPDIVSKVISWLCFPIGTFFLFIDPIIL